MKKVLTHSSLGFVIFCLAMTADNRILFVPCYTLADKWTGTPVMLEMQDTSSFLSQIDQR